MSTGCWRARSGFRGCQKSESPAAVIGPTGTDGPRAWAERPGPASLVPTGERRCTASLMGERAGLEFVVECPPVRAPVGVDREMWATIVSNLLSDALKFTFEGGISVALGRENDIVELAVRDTGIGIGTEDQVHLFKRFHRIEGARSRTFEGSGIGLALVAELVALHGGSIGASSAPGEGSTFTVRLPVGREPTGVPAVEEGPVDG